MKKKSRGYTGGKKNSTFEKAVRAYEVPAFMINSTLIATFIRQHRYQYSMLEREHLKQVTVSKWRYVAKERLEPSLYNRTSAVYNDTPHYDMKEIAKFLIDNKETIEEEYKNYVDSQKISDGNMKYAVLDMQFWNGVKHKPAALGLKIIPGILVGNTFYYKEYHALKGKTKKTNVQDGYSKWMKTYDSYDELVREHFDFHNTKETFDAIINQKSI